jgi:GlcNAc-P-P-Und epimerase
MPKKITVIGGSGFVGTNLCRRFASRQQDFEIIDIKMSNQFPKNCKIADVRDLDALRKTIMGDVVINLAAVHRDDVRDKYLYELTNVDGAKNIATICEEKGINKIVFTSSVAVYGFAEPGTDEKGEIKPFNEYGSTKWRAEEIFREWNSKDDRSLIIVRPTVIFGEGNRGNVYNLFSQIGSGMFIMIGSGENRKSIAYIENVVSFLDECLFAECKYGLYNYVDTPDFTMNELVTNIRYKLRGEKNVGLRVPYWLGMTLGYFADFVIWVTGRKLPISSVRVKKFVSSSEFSSAKFSLNNYLPPVSLIDGIDKTLQSEFVNPIESREIFFTE